MSVIPFISNHNPSTRAQWIHALQTQLADHTVLDFNDCSDVDKSVAEVAIVADLDPQQLLHFPRLVWVQSLWAGVEKLLATEALNHIPLVRLIDPSLSQRMSEAVLAWSLYLHRDMPAYHKLQKQKVWQSLNYCSAEDRCIAILGCGELGIAAMKRLQQNHFKVSGWSRTAKHIDGITHHHGQSGLNEILASADIVVCLLPLTAQTHGLLNRQSLSSLKSGAGIINFGRGPLIDKQALLEGLDSGRISHAVLDVFDKEPLPEQSILWTHPDITVLPHISAETNIKTAAKVAADNLNRWFTSGIKPAVVDRRKGY